MPPYSPYEQNIPEYEGSGADTALQLGIPLMLLGGGTLGAGALKLLGKGAKGIFDKATKGVRDAAAARANASLAARTADELAPAGSGMGRSVGQGVTNMSPDDMAAALKALEAPAAEGAALAGKRQALSRTVDQLREAGTPVDADMLASINARLQGSKLAPPSSNKLFPPKKMDPNAYVPGQNQLADEMLGGPSPAIMAEQKQLALQRQKASQESRYRSRLGDHLGALDENVGAAAALREGGVKLYPPERILGADAAMGPGAALQAAKTTAGPRPKPSVQNLATGPNARPTGQLSNKGPAPAADQPARAPVNASTTQKVPNPSKTPVEPGTQVSPEIAAQQKQLQQAHAAERASLPPDVAAAQQRWDVANQAAGGQLREMAPEFRHRLDQWKAQRGTRVDTPPAQPAPTTVQPAPTTVQPAPTTVQPAPTAAVDPNFRRQRL
jgi:hypothetical protein